MAGLDPATQQASVRAPMSLCARRRGRTGWPARRPAMVKAVEQS